MSSIRIDPERLSVLDRPNSYIGKTVPRPNLDRLLQGRGSYISDMELPRMAHVVFLRSPHAHAKIVSIDAAAAKQMPGVSAVVTGKELAAVITPWVGVLSHLKGLKSAPQSAIAVDRVCWQGEAVAAIVATSRAAAEDAAERVAVEYQELEAATDMRTALDPATPVIHASLGDNLAFERIHDAGAVDQAFAGSDAVVEADFVFGRHTGVTLEPRSVVADWNAAEARLTIYQGTQAPHMVQNIAALHLGLREQQVRVVCKDVGGSFGIKVHIYADEMATYALAKLLRRPMKFVADRVESFNTDIHARDHRCKGKIGVTRDGTITAFEIDDLTGIGPYSMYPRTSAIEANQVVNLVGGPYTNKNYRARARVVFQNKNVMCQYRAVGHPIACSVTEGLVDLAAMKIGMDPVEIRRRNLIADDAYPCVSPSGLRFEQLSHHASLAKIVEMMNYRALRAEQAKLRKGGVLRGIGIASFIEVTNPSAAFYGVGGARISSQDGVAVRLDAQGSVICQTSITEQGQGSESLTAQIVGSVLGVSMDRVRIILGDTDMTPYGGGTWASRGAGIGGEAALQATKILRKNILDVAAVILQSTPAELDIINNAVVNVSDGAPRIELNELARIVYFRPDTLPPGIQPELMATKHFVPREYPFAFTNGVQAAWVEVDTDTGFVKLLKHWVVEDCGTIINPQLVDEQIRGGVVQGLGAALFEKCIYDDRGQLTNANMADYLVPMSGEMPDIDVGHVVSPTRESELGAKGVGEAGTAGAAAAVTNAVNDALKPFGTIITEIPLTPRVILTALGKI
ncbi:MULTISPECIES: xanthine dehydrogenase family protein molybdopterin-binding subunit [unclassified Bradyrhizobium]|uniref:xanthine dehydrogenase family protein molybdopterin-binding subunit n=1 Tax=unclassified Bradyrhizobium TaxID=2631580 RepID=UPI00247A12D1|nr:MULTISPECIES: xanthine dehydrogenase family protein molybdopterin-binding subunit [unclassified Bradyrhizobium]WGR69637.1 xanthine dehydrogenase family protein molybdopterin-binding subunit [Bradyrhizobium sp. ISRA426]WGR81694.1 xanthine dehydrogenase family protein molybdopterin-binding subunit [Bradyrhizobium sp. ISRA430]WGR84878.1 xanthine dehydrogenase family protein molybdopterin-binding subunit [Bradyrhizobium sp. ISRA432]